MSMTMKPTMVVLDLDDTLYEYGPAHAAGRDALSAFVSDELGVRPPAFEEALDRARLSVKERLGDSASSHNRLLYCHEALELVGLRSQPKIALAMEQEYWRNYLLASRLRPGATELLDRFRYHGVVTAVVTDLTAQIQFRKLTYLGLADYVDHVVCSEETAGEKISLLPFELLFARVGKSAVEQVWFIGDQDFDAPVAALIDRRLIGGGQGFVRGVGSDDYVTSWQDLAEIETVVERVFREDDR